MSISEFDRLGKSEIGLGHNSQVSFDKVVEENLHRNVYFVHLQALQRCMHDPRLTHCDRQVLAKVSERTNNQTGMAFPGVNWLAANIVYYVHGQPRHYSPATIDNSLSKLARPDFAYIMSARRAPKPGARAVAHYAITPPSLEQLQEEIAKACAAIRTAPRRSFPKADLTAGNEVRTDLTARDEVRPDVTAKDEVRRAKLQQNQHRARSDLTSSNGDDRGADLIASSGADLISRNVPNISNKDGSIYRGKSPQDAQDEMHVALGGDAAFAAKNITVTPSGAIIIGDEFRADLRKTYTDGEINGALDCTLSRCGPNPTKLQILRQIRTQCVYRKQDAAKTGSGPRPGGVTKGVFR